MRVENWGIAVRDITRMMALERHRKATTGVLVDSIRGGSGAATAKLPLQSEDVILQVEGQVVDNVAALGTNHREDRRRQNRASCRSSFYSSATPNNC